MTIAASRFHLLPAAGLLAAATLVACAAPVIEEPILPELRSGYRQDPGALLAGETMAVSYSGFRAGQHPDRGDGAVDPSPAEVLEDLRLLSEHGVRLIRLYDTKENSANVLGAIREHDLPIKVALGIWLEAEISNHMGCPWLYEPIPASRLEQNARRNDAEIQRGIELAGEYPEIVATVSVGSESLVEWTDHMTSLDSVIAYVRKVKSAVVQPVTVAENYVWWAEHGDALAAEVDYLAVDTYPIWENKLIDDALAFTDENVATVKRAHPDHDIVVFDTGWATTAMEFGDRASEENQARYYAQLRAWARATNTTVIFFGAFDESWKGDPEEPLSAEKHWGLWFEDRTPKLAARRGR